MNDQSTEAAAEAAPDGGHPLVLFFREKESGKPHASRFEAADAALAERAAGLMGLRALRLVTPEQVELGAKLPAGRVFESGRAFVPFTRAAVFDQLDADSAAFTPERPAEAEVPSAAPRKPKSSRPPRAAAGDAPSAEEAAPGPTTPPADRGAIGVGHRVLAAEENAPEVWYLAEVTALKGPALLQLVWVGEQYAAEPPIVRHRDHLALLPPAIATTLK